MDFSLVVSLDKKTWRDFVDGQPQGNIFHTPEMLEVFDHAHGHRSKLYAAVDDDHQVRALLPLVQVTIIDGPLRRLTTRAIAYGGLLCLPDACGMQALQSLLSSYSQRYGREVLFTELRNLSDVSLLDPVLSECGFAYEEHLDYLINLEGVPEEVLQRIGSRTRQHIRRAVRKGNITVEQIADRSQIATWYQLVQKTYQSAQIPLAHRTLFEAAFDILHPRGMIIFWLARIGSSYVAASAELLYKDIIYGWYGAVDRAYASESPGELLTWRILEWGALHGYKIYDFGGAGKPGEEYGVKDFKAKFGGQLVCFGRNRKVHFPALLHCSEWGYQTYRKFLKRSSK